MEKVLISSCLLAKKVRYNASDVKVKDTYFSVILSKWLADKRVVSICPEVDAGMSIPRESAEILNGDGNAVWSNISNVYEFSGKDVTEVFKKGALIALQLCQKYQIKVAVLTENSPTCGSSMIYDGTFSDQRTKGVGVTTALLQKHGIKVFNQYEMKKANHYLQSIESNTDNK